MYIYMNVYVCVCIYVYACAYMCAHKDFFLKAKKGLRLNANKKLQAFFHL